MAITFIARMKVFAEKEEYFRQLCHKLEAAVIAAEPNTLLYRFYRLDEPLHYAVIESFTDEAAEDIHMNADHFKEYGPDMIACLDGGYHREYLHPIDPE